MVAVLLWAVFSSPAFAQKQHKYPVVCWPGSGLPDMLAERYKEFPTSQGVSNNGVLFQIYESEDGKTWTVLFLDPRLTLSCMVGAGDDWTPLDVPSF